jgi:Polysaccharide pyruvyl transferase
VRVLVAGWFSFERMGATAGDLMAAEVVEDWLREAGLPFERAVARPFTGGVDWRTVDPRAYTHFVFVCGPCGNGAPLTDMLGAFRHCHRVGVDVSMLQPVGEWNPFDLLIERDSDRTTRPDVSLLCNLPKVPVVGLCLVHPQKEYGRQARHDEVEAAIHRLLAAREAAVVPIDTRLDENGTGLRTPAEVESLIARMDLVVTTRLHGMVLALKNGVPPLAIDPIADGAKVRRQAEVIGWPVVAVADKLDDMALQRAFDYCLTPECRAEAQSCADRAFVVLQRARDDFLTDQARSAYRCPRTTT